MAVSAEFLAAVDDWRSQQRPVASRSEAIRYLVEVGMKVSKAKARLKKGKR